MAYGTRHVALWHSTVYDELYISKVHMSYKQKNNKKGKQIQTGDARFSSESGSTCESETAERINTRYSSSPRAPTVNFLVLEVRATNKMNIVYFNMFVIGQKCLDLPIGSPYRTYTVVTSYHNVPKAKLNSCEPA